MLFTKHAGHWKNPTYDNVILRAYDSQAAVALLRAPRYRHLFAGHESVVVVVCGGSGVNWDIMDQWRQDGLWGSGELRA